MGYSLIFWILAAICCAVCDTLVHHFSTSVFYKPDILYFSKCNKFWNPELSAHSYIIPHTGYKVDAWHLFKSAMIIFQCAAIVMAWQSGEALLNVWWFYLTVFVFMGIGWNLVFNLFYNWLLKKSIWTSN